MPTYVCQFDALLSGASVRVRTVVRGAGRRSRAVIPTTVEPLAASTPGVDKIPVRPGAWPCCCLGAVCCAASHVVRTVLCLYVCCTCTNTYLLTGCPRKLNDMLQKSTREVVGVRAVPCKQVLLCCCGCWLVVVVVVVVVLCCMQ